VLTLTWLSYSFGERKEKMFQSSVMICRGVEALLGSRPRSNILGIVDRDVVDSELLDMSREGVVDSLDTVTMSDGLLLGIVDFEVCLGSKLLLMSEQSLGD
jgi:hypothetical protein